MLELCFLLDDLICDFGESGFDVRVLYNDNRSFS